jgi:hypothetical protein
MADFLPTRFADRLAWSANFSDLLTLDPPGYFVSIAQAAAYAVVHGEFAAKQETATNPLTRGPAASLARDFAWDQVEPMARELARQIQGNPAITPMKLQALALTVRDTSRTSIGRPTTKPIVNIERIMNLAHLIRIRDEATPTSSARPSGATGWEVWCKVGAAGESEPVSIDDCKYVGLATRVPYTVPFTPADANKTVWYLVRAINAKGQAGPLSDQISGTIAA